MKKIISTGVVFSLAITAASSQVLSPEERQKQEKAENEKTAIVIEAKVTKDKADKALLPALDATGKAVGGLGKEAAPVIERPAIKKDEEDEAREKNKNAKVNN